MVKCLRKTFSQIPAGSVGGKRGSLSQTTSLDILKSVKGQTEGGKKKERKNTNRKAKVNHFERLFYLMRF